MSRPTTLTGWWKLLLDERANGSVALLASLLGTTPKTVGRWASREIKLPDTGHRKTLRKVAGEDLLNATGCPKYLRSHRHD